MAQAHQLKNLTINHLSSDLPKYLFWKRLRELNLWRWGNTGELNLVVSQLSLIEVIEGCPRYWPDAGTPVTTLGHIKSINLTCQLKYLARLQLPRLEKLVWTEANPSSFTNSLVPSTNPNWRLSFPNLLEFGAQAAGEIFELALKELPNVQTAILEPIPPKKSQDTWALDLIRSLAAAEEILCPRLRHLTLGDLRNQVTANKTLAKPLIRRLIKSRKELGTPIEHFQIAWTKRAGKNEETIQYA